MEIVNCSLSFRQKAESDGFLDRLEKMSIENGNFLNHNVDVVKKRSGY